MSQTAVPSWLRYSERLFALNFIAFSFVMFSCWFPTGFSSTFSTLAFVFALPTFFYWIRTLELAPFEYVGLLLFAWLSLSVMWSDAPVMESLGYLSEYRIYFMVPVLIMVLARDEQAQRWALGTAMIGAFIALVTSYGLGLGWWQIEGAELSLANRIYHGFIMSSFLLACLLIARETTGVIRLAAFITALLVAYNVLNIETGRTGYLQVASVCIAFIVLTFSRVQSVLAVGATVILIGVSYLSFDRFHDRVNLTVNNVQRMIVNNDYQSSVGYRLEFYQGAINIGLDYPLTGVGVGDATRTLQSMSETGEIRQPTDNVHSEFMNMLVVGGFPALLLFAGFVFSVVHGGLAVRGRSRVLGDAMVGLGVIVLVSAIFNSTIKDYGEKHALVIMLTILGAQLLKVNRLNANTEMKSMRLLRNSDIK